MNNSLCKAGAKKAVVKRREAISGIVDLVNAAGFHFKLIALTRGKVAIVDPEDFEKLNERVWSYAAVGYAVSGNPDDYKKMDYMHRVIMGSKEGMEVDHRNHDKLDNRKANLRDCTPSENKGNLRSRRKTKSGIKGVHWRPERNKWSAHIRKNGIRKHLGMFDSPENAAAAYAIAAKELFGEFYRLD